MPPKARVLGIGLLVAMLVAAPGTSSALEPRDPVPVAAVSGPGAKFVGYATPVVVVRAKGFISFVNLDADRHNFVHDVDTDGFGGPSSVPWCKKKAKGHEHGHGHGPLCPVFYSPLVGLGETVEVMGRQNLKAGVTYTFFCTLHHGMKGRLVVVP